MQTDSLADTQWDVVIEGTGLPQSLLALYVPPASLPDASLRLTRKDA